MKIEIQKLKDILECLKPGLSGAKETTEQSNCYAFTESRIHTYNDDVSVSVPNPIDFQGAILSLELTSLLNKLKGDEATITFTDEELVIKAGRTKAGIILQKDIMMPIDEIVIPEKWNKLPANFLDGLRSCIFSTSSDIELVLNNIDCNKNILQSSDNERATRFTISSKLRKSFLIPSNSAKELLGMQDVKEYSADEEWVHFKAKDGVVFSCRCSYEEYPDASSYFEVDGFEFEFPKDTKELLERAGIFAESDFVQDKLVQISITTKGVFKIRAEGETGWIEETKRIQTKPKSDTSFHINPQYLQQILNQTNKATIGTELVWFSVDNFVHVVALGG